MCVFVWLCMHVCACSSETVTIYGYVCICGREFCNGELRVGNIHRIRV